MSERERAMSEDVRTILRNQVWEDVSLALTGVPGVPGSVVAEVSDRVAEHVAAHLPDITATSVLAAFDDWATIGHGTLSRDNVMHFLDALDVTPIREDA